ncbi:hypothetical protein [Jeongeupia sp. USM3]|uniref:hypothetical protein n=1 Tax=Jeongeupia sp. USM3 TaxID=1906741 RepID=UPI00089DD890|nr:hypothetical protein [Jeongeupia sp. USM3]AOX99307.1 hypothetical protein BJP62_01865 [Jeongeupia sp. USM3]
MAAPDSLAALRTLRDSLLGVQAALDSGDPDTVLDALARYDAAADAQQVVDWRASPQRAQAEALLRESQALLAALMPLIRQARDESQGALQNLHNTDKLNRAYR